MVSGNVMKKVFFATLIIILIALFYFFGRDFLNKDGDSNSKASITQHVMILKTIDHPALDVNQAGIIAELKSCCPNIGVSSQSANGDPNLAVQISRKFSDQKPDVVITIGTMASQAASLNIQDSPIIFSAVTDPISAGLVETLEVPGKNVTGVADQVNTLKQFSVFKVIFPTLKTIGIVYNPSEANSVALLDIMLKAAAKTNLTIKVAPANNTGEVQSATQNIIDSVDMIFINNDNTALSALQSIIKVADAAKKPVFTSDIENIGQGVVAAIGPDQAKLGQQTAKMAVQAIANKGKVSNIPVQFPKVMTIAMDPVKAKMFADTIVIQKRIDMPITDEDDANNSGTTSGTTVVTKVDSVNNTDQSTSGGSVVTNSADSTTPTVAVSNNVVDSSSKAAAVDNNPSSSNNKVLSSNDKSSTTVTTNAVGNTAATADSPSQQQASPSVADNSVPSAGVTGQANNDVSTPTINNNIQSTNNIDTTVKKN